ncbi:hypothetical protein [Oryza sativa Japonica Group]|uniref:Uncharacterized protein n=1 Tax=Oryza sativa subsp. japonica TaxID=39947 RepID=Q5QM48_ORYSJ|nr:hypothetical protein [Oryza sativa Japonica Group]
MIVCMEAWNIDICGWRMPTIRKEAGKALSPFSTTTDAHAADSAATALLAIPDKQRRDARGVVACAPWPENPKWLPKG